MIRNGRIHYDETKEKYANASTYAQNHGIETKMMKQKKTDITGARTDT